MIKRQLLVFLLRWIVNTAAMAICVNWFGHLSVEPSFMLYVVAGLVFSLVNSIVKPLATLVSLPLIILSVGIFSLVLNVAMVALTIWIMPGMEMGFFGVIFSTITIAIINWVVSLILPILKR